MGFGIPRDSLSGISLCFPLLGFNMLIRLWGTTYFPVGVLLCFSFIGELHGRKKTSAQDNIFEYDSPSSLAVEVSQSAQDCFGDN